MPVSMDRTGMLNDKQMQAIFYMLEGDKISEIAKKVGVTYATVNNWTKSPTWQRYYAKEADESTRAIRNRYLHKTRKRIDNAGELIDLNLAMYLKSAKEGEPTPSHILSIFANYTKDQVLSSHAIDPAIGGKGSIESQQDKADVAAKLQDEWDNEEAEVMDDEDNETADQKLRKELEEKVS